MAFTRKGYGQVEPNQLSAQKTGQIYASLPLDPDVEILQNGEFMYYDYANNMVDAGKTASGTVIATKGEPMLVFNEIKLYDEFWRHSLKDFAMFRVGDNYVTVGPVSNNAIGPDYGDGALTPGVAPVGGHAQYPYRMDGIAPRLLKTNVGDIYTTNMVALTKLAGDPAVETPITYVVGDILAPVAVEHTKANGVGTYKTLVLTPQDSMPETGMAWHVVKVYTMPDGQPGLKIQRIQ